MVTLFSLSITGTVSSKWGQKKRSKINRLGAEFSFNSSSNQIQPSPTKPTDVVWRRGGVPGGVELKTVTELTGI